MLQTEAANGAPGFWLQGLSDSEPHRPLRGLKDVLRIGSAAGVLSWTTASWLSSPQSELAGRTPREALVDGDDREVAMLAQHAAMRLGP